MSADKIAIWVFAVVAASCVTMLSGFWWLYEAPSISQGVWGVLMIAAFTFNRIPTEGLAWLKRKEVRWFYIPILVLNLSTFIVGYIVTT